MKRMRYGIQWRSICCLGLALGMLALLGGCAEVNVAIDSVLGLQSPAVSSAPETSPLSVVLAKKKTPGEKPAEDAAPGKTPQPAAAPAGTPAKSQVADDLQGKKRPPGQLSPAAAARARELKPKETVFVMARDPFEQPTEILPSECPPSMPLCRFDRSQLKLVGVIQVSDGEYKGMVEDPDGRGYYIMSGMQIGGGTVTQVTSKGVTIHLHRTRQDVQLPLFSEARGDSEF